MSLYKVLNHCKTGPGQRLLKLWILQPLVDLNKIGKFSLVCDDYYLKLLIQMFFVTFLLDDFAKNALDLLLFLHKSCIVLKFDAILLQLPSNANLFTIECNV